jgi:hypothetical protein
VPLEEIRATEKLVMERHPEVEIETIEPHAPIIPP